MTLSDTIVRNFRVLVDHGDVSLYALAIATGEPVAIVRSWYSGRTPPALYHLEKICDAYHLDPRFFFYGHRADFSPQAGKGPYHTHTDKCGQKKIQLAKQLVEA